MAFNVLAATLLVIVFYSFLFVVCGYTLLKQLVSLEKFNDKFLIVGSSFFAGMSIYLPVLRTLTQLTHQYHICFGICTVLTLCLYIKTRKEINNLILQFFSWKILTSFFFIFLFLFFKEMWGDPNPPHLNPFYSLASLHTFRYTNLAQYIYYANYIPVVTQSYAQSILATFPMLFGLFYCVLALSVWLCISKFFMILFLFGILRQLKVGKLWQYLGVVIVTCATVALSFVHVLVIDSGSPFIQNGYSDSIGGICSFVLYCLILNLFKAARKNNILFGTYTVFSVLYWAMCASQNTILLIGLLGMNLLQAFFTKTYAKRQIALLLLTVTIALGLGATQGGMVVIKPLAEQTRIAGMMNSTNEMSSLQLVPIMPYHNTFIHQWSWDEDLLGNMYGKLSFYKKTKNFNMCAYIYELLFLDSLRIIFFPLVGIIWFKLYAFKKREQANIQNHIANDLIVLFAGGYFIAFLFLYHGYKWELSRFMIPGYFFGLTAFAYTLSKWAARSKTRAVLGMLLVCYMVSGYLLAKPLIPIDNLKNTKKIILFQNRYVEYRPE